MGSHLEGKGLGGSLLSSETLWKNITLHVVYRWWGSWAVLILKTEIEETFMEFL